MKAIVYIVILLVFYSCENKKSNVEIDIKKEFYKNGLLKNQGYVVSNKKEGKHFWYNEKSGQIKTIIEYKNDIINGKKVDFFENSNQIKSIINYSNGKLTDTSFYFYNNGKLRAYFVYTGVWLYKYFFSKNEKLNEIRILVKPYNLEKHTISEQIFFDSNGDTIYKKSRFYKIDKKLNLRYFCNGSNNNNLIIGDIKKDFSYNSNLVDTIDFVNVVDISKLIDNDSRFIILDNRRVYDSLKGYGTITYFTFGEYPR
jgi:antitoxin component YwqK of YwqJK toxin-antitoxin module